MVCDILSIEPFLASLIRVPYTLIVDLYIISDALRTDRIRHSNGRVRLSSQLLLQQISIHACQGLVSYHLGSQFWTGFTRSRRCISNAQRTTRLKYQRATRHTIFITLLAGVYLNLDDYPCSAGVVRRRGSIELGQNETKSKNQWHILSGAFSNRYSGSYHFNIFGCRIRYGIDYFSQMFGDYLGYALAHGFARICLSINS